MAEKQKKSQRLKYELVVICLFSTCILVALGVISNWAIYRNMNITMQVKEDKLLRHFTIQQLSQLADTAALLIDNSASSGTDVGLKSAKQHRGSMLILLSTAREHTKNTVETEQLKKVDELIQGFYSTGELWVKAVIDMELASIRPAFADFDNKSSKLKALLIRLRQDYRTDLDNALLTTLSTSRGTLYFSMLSSIFVIPLIILLLVRISVSNVKLYKNLEEKIDLQNKAIHTIEKQNKNLNTEVRQRKKTEATFRENVQILRLYLEYTPAATAMCDLEMRYLAYSHRWITDYNLPDENLIGRCHYDVFENIPEHWKQQHQRCFQNEVIVNDEEPFTRADGSVDWVCRNLYPWRTKDGDVGGLIMFTEVITKKKKAERDLLESENRLHTIGENLPGGMIYQAKVDSNGGRQFTYVSGGVKTLYGHSREEVLTDPNLLYDNIVAEDVERMKKEEGQAIRTLETIDVIVRMKTHPDEIRWHRLVSKPRKLDSGEILFDGIDLDITDLKRAEVTNHQRRQFLESVLYHVPDAIITLDSGHKVIEWNRGAEEMFGYTRGETIGKNLDDLVSRDEYHKEATGKTQGVLAGRRLESFETVRFHKNGTPLHVIAAGSPIMIDDRLANVVAVYTDITRLKTAEKEMQQKADMLRRIIDIVPSGIFAKNAEGRFLMANKSVAKRYDLSVEALTGRLQQEVHLNTEETGSMLAADRRAIESGQTVHIPEQSFTNKKGVVRWLDIVKVPCPISDFGEPAIVGLSTDITERMEADKELQRLRNYLANIVNSMPSVLVGIDIDGRVTQWNRQAEQVTGIAPEKAQGQLLEHVIPRLRFGMDLIQKAIENQEVQRKSKINQPADDGTHYEDVTIFPLIANGVEGAVIRIDDVTERVRMEEMIIQSEKMLSVGGLAAGMAHEINNPLAGMMQTASVMADRLTQPISANERAAEAAGTTVAAITAYVENRGIDRMLENIKASGRRAADIVENMLGFARKVDSGFSSHNLAELLDLSVELAATDYDLKKQYDFKRIKMIKAYQSDLPLVPCEKQKIQQVFLNILRNGAEALHLKGDKHQHHFILRAVSDADSVRIEIEDNGPGMDEETRHRVFEPFYTTKPQGIGTGLGLSISYFIVTENHGGRMSVESAPGKGSKFIITLPRDSENHSTQLNKRK